MTSNQLPQQQQQNHGPPPQLPATGPMTVYSSDLPFEIPRLNFAPMGCAPVSLNILYHVPMPVNYQVPGPSALGKGPDGAPLSCFLKLFFIGPDPVNAPDVIDKVIATPFTVSSHWVYDETFDENFWLVIFRSVDAAFFVDQRIHVAGQRDDGIKTLRCQTMSAVQGVFEYRMIYGEDSTRLWPETFSNSVGPGIVMIQGLTKDLNPDYADHLDDDENDHIENVIYNWVVGIGPIKSITFPTNDNGMPTIMAVIEMSYTAQADEVIGLLQARPHGILERDVNLWGIHVNHVVGNPVATPGTSYDDDANGFHFNAFRRRWNGPVLPSQIVNTNQSSDLQVRAPAIPTPAFVDVFNQQGGPFVFIHPVQITHLVHLPQRVQLPQPAHLPQPHHFPAVLQPPPLPVQPPQPVQPVQPPQPNQNSPTASSGSNGNNLSQRLAGLSVGQASASDMASQRLLESCGGDYDPAFSYQLNPPAGAPFKNVVDINRIASGEDVRTTIMIRNIPNRVTQSDMKELLDEVCHGCFDFLYLRIDFANNCNVGYAFVNFSLPEDIITFATAYKGRRWAYSEKVLEISYATMQGRECLVAKFRNSSVMKEAPTSRPKLYYTNGHADAGEEEEFPLPDNYLKLARSTQNAAHIGLYSPVRNGPGGTAEPRRRRGNFDRGTSFASIEQLIAENRMLRQAAGGYFRR